MNCTSVTPQSIVLCRLCSKSHEFYVNIFISNESCEIIVEEAIQDLLGLPVTVGDGLPNVVCRLCLRKLFEFREFKNMCFKSANELRAYALGNDSLVSKIKDEDAADVETSREGSNQENTFPNDIHLTEVYITTPDDLAIGNVSLAKEEFGSTENALVVKEEVNNGEHRIEGDVPANALTSFAVDPLAVDTMALKEESQEPKVAAGEGNSLGDTSSHNHIQVTEVFVPFPDELAMGTVALKEEAQEPKGTAGDGNSLGDLSPHSHIQVTEVFVPVPDQLSIGIETHVKEDWRPAELMVNEDIGDGADCIENGVPAVSLSSVNVDPLAVDTATLKEEAQELNGDPKKGNSLDDKCPHNHIQMTEVFVPVPDQLAMGIGCHVEKYLRPTALMYKEEIGNGLDCIENDIPVDTLSSVNVDPLAVDTAVDHCYNIGGMTREPGKESYKCDADRKRTSQNKELDTPSSNPTHEENLQLKYPKPNSFVVDYFPARRVKKQKKNVKVYAPSNKFSQLNDRAGPVRNHECDQLGHQAENTRFPKEYICNYCNTRYSEIYSLAHHIKVHVDGIRSASVLPKKEFSPRFSQHLLVKAFKCAQCGKTFGRSSELNGHSVVHTDVKRFKCNECGKMFTRKANLKTHSLIHTDVKRFKCNECGKMFTRKGTLKTHSLIHTGVKQFKCNECGKMFTWKCSLEMHSVIHTGVKRFKCNECGMMFTKSDNLKSHLLVHTGVKQFKCKECGMMFTKIGNLKSHLLVHTGVKQFKCNECGKTFSRKSHLNEHSVVHTGVKRFKCNECGNMFTKSSYLKSHSVIHTGVKPFKCFYCGELFKWRASLRRHLLSHADRNPSN